MYLFSLSESSLGFPLCYSYTSRSKGSPLSYRSRQDHGQYSLTSRPRIMPAGHTLRIAHSNVKGQLRIGSRAILRNIVNQWRGKQVRDRALVTLWVFECQSMDLLESSTVAFNLFYRWFWVWNSLINTINNKVCNLYNLRKIKWNLSFSSASSSYVLFIVVCWARTMPFQIYRCSLLGLWLCSFSRPRKPPWAIALFLSFPKWGSFWGRICMRHRALCSLAVYFHTLVKVVSSLAGLQ